MDSLISRQAAIDALWLKYCNRPLDSDRYLIKDIRDIINSLPSAQPQRWIPAGKNKTPKDGRYICDYGDCIDFGAVIDGKWYVQGVVAYMPLPEPYKGES